MKIDTPLFATLLTQEEKAQVLSIECLMSNPGAQVTRKEIIIESVVCGWSLKNVVGPIQIKVIMKWSHVAVLTPSFYMARMFGVTPLLARKRQGIR